MPHFSIIQCPVGQKQNFSYIIYDSATKKAVVVDPAWEVQKILNIINLYDLEITDILLTHSHYDHINGLAEILSLSTAQVHLSLAEANFWIESAQYPIVVHNDNDIISIGNTTITVLQTAGHTIGSVCYYLDGYLITGDTLFIPRCGRCDLPSGDMKQMYHSLKRIKETLSPNTIIYPGHDYGEVPTAILGDLLKSNGSLQCNTCADFIKYRMV